MLFIVVRCGFVGILVFCLVCLCFLVGFVSFNVVTLRLFNFALCCLVYLFVFSLFCFDFVEFVWCLLFDLLVCWLGYLCFSICVVWWLLTWVCAYCMCFCWFVNWRVGLRGMDCLIVCWLVWLGYVLLNMFVDLFNGCWFDCLI